MAAGAWKVFNRVKNRAFDGATEGNEFDKALSLFVLTSGATGLAGGLLSTATAQVANNLCAATNWAGADTSKKAVSAGDSLVSATGNNYRLKINTATSYVWTATQATQSPAWLVLAEATDGDLIAWCDINSTGANVSITPGNTLTVTFPANGVFLLDGAT